jgi:arsenite methyltransferase
MAEQVTSPDDVRETVRERYAAAAVAVQEGRVACCSGSPAASGSCGCGTDIPDACGDQQFGAGLYEISERDQLPDAARLASLGCGNPTAVAALHEGETVLDLGSGGGIDVLLSARRVGATGKAYGLDMTDQMLELARRNQSEAGVENAEFLKGDIEAVPLPPNSVDVVISNCVINLSGDKRKVLSEAFRVLKPGGRFAVSDVVVRGHVPEPIKKNMELWIGCVAGALEEQEFLQLLRDVGFTKPSIEPTRIYKAEDAAAFLGGSGLDSFEFASQIDGKFMGAFVRATKPLECCTPGSPCCGPDC